MEEVHRLTPLIEGGDFRDDRLLVERGDAYFEMNDLENSLQDYTRAIAIKSDNEEYYLKRLRVYQHLKDYTNVLSDWRNALRIKPESFEVRDISDQLIPEVDLDETLIEFTKSIESSPLDFELYLNRSYLYEMKKMDVEAINDYTKSLELKNMNYFAFRKRGICYISLKEFEKSQSDLEKALTIDHDCFYVYLSLGYLYYHMNEFEKAIDNYSKVIKISPSVSSSYRSIGIIYRENMKDNDQSISYLTQAIEACPLDYRAFYHRGLTFRSMSEEEKALLDFSKVIELDTVRNPMDRSCTRSSHYHIGVIHMQDDLKDYEKSLTHFTKAIEIDPGISVFYYRRGVVFDMMDQEAKAISDLSKAIEIEPKKAYNFRRRGDIHRRMKEYQKSILDYTEAIKLDEKDLTSLNHRGCMFAKIEEFEKSISDFSKVIELDPNKTEAFQDRADAFREMKRYGKAISDYTRAIELDPSDFVYVGLRGYTYQLMGEYEKAIGDYTSVKDSENSSLHVLGHQGRAECLKELKKYDEALSAISKALEIEPENMECLQLRSDLFQLLNFGGKALTDRRMMLELKYNELLSLYSTLGPSKSKQYWETLKLRANFYLENKEFEKAVSDYTKLLEIQPDDVYVYRMRGTCYQTMTMNDKFQLAKSRDLYKKGFGTSKKEEWKRHAELAVSDFKKALELLERGFEDSDKSVVGRIIDRKPYLYGYIGQIYYKHLMDFEKAFEYYVTACELKPSDTEYKENLKDIAKRLPELDKKKKVALELILSDNYRGMSSMMKDMSTALKLVRIDGMRLKKASDDLRNDMVVVSEAVMQNGLSLQFASEKLRNEKIIVLEAVKQNPSAFQFASENLKRNFEFKLEALKVSPEILQFTDIGEPSSLVLDIIKETFKVGKVEERILNWNWLECGQENHSSQSSGFLSQFSQSSSSDEHNNYLTSDHLFPPEWEEVKIGSIVSRVLDSSPNFTSKILLDFMNLHQEKMIAGFKSNYTKEIKKVKTSAKRIGMFITSVVEGMILRIVEKMKKDFRANITFPASNFTYCGFYDEKREKMYGFGLQYMSFSKGLINRKNYHRRLFYGTFNSSGLRHGGKLCKEFSDKDGTLHYEGSFRNGKKEGKGIIFKIFKQESYRVFEGRFQGDRPHGRGESFEPSSGVVQRGNWVNGVLDEGSVDSYTCPIIPYKDVQKQLNDDQDVGEGAFGKIYRVKTSSIPFFRKKKKIEKKIGTHVAVKIMKCRSNWEREINFRLIRRGIGLCYSVKSENVLESYGIIKGSKSDSKVGYVMRLCEKSIDDLIEDGNIDIEEKIRILHETARGMHALHSKLLIHRDLKWGNVLMDFDRTIKITDFDTVKEDEVQWRLRMLSQSSRVGTPGFRPPEVCVGKKYTDKCDVYAFGLMIYALLWEIKYPYATMYQCSCGKFLNDILNSNTIEEHVAYCNLRPALVAKELKEFPSFLIDLMIQCWDKNQFTRPSFEEILFRFSLRRKKNFVKIVLQFPRNEGIEDQTMYLTKPFRKSAIVDWVENVKFKKKNVRLDDEEDDGEEETEGEETEATESTKVIRVENRLLGTVHTDEDLLKIIENQEIPILQLELSHVDETIQLSGVIERKISLEEFLEIEEEVKVLRERDLESNKKIRELEKENEILKEKLKEFMVEKEEKNMKKVEKNDRVDI